MSKSSPTSPQVRPPPASGDKQFCGVIAESVTQAQKRKEKPQPWIVRKMWIAVTFGLMGYAGYAYIARLCLPMVARKGWALGSQTTGVLLLIFFSILYLWLVWAYFKVILTSPGYARDHVARTGKPPLLDSSHYTYPHRNGAPPISETAKSDSIIGHGRRSQTHEPTPLQGDDSVAGPSYEHMLQSDSTPSHPLQVTEPNVGSLDAIMQPRLATDNKLSISTEQLESSVSQESQHTTSSVPSDARRVRRLSRQAARSNRLDELNVYRKPSSTPVLEPVFRYCERDALVKPYRAHHCRACGTCVLRYDHHCPWIGQCVGARNHKFFLNFSFATSIFTAYIVASDLFFVIKASASSNLDPHLIVMLALAALFFLFTISLSVCHVRLITHGQTTVESMQIKDKQEQEEQILARGFGWWECRAKRKRKRAFDEEWGSMNTEGNMWWRGSAYAEWIDIMGKHWVGWIFPIGSGLSDGLEYPINPRFDSEGRLRKRSQWPEGLR